MLKGVSKWRGILVVFALLVFWEVVTSGSETSPFLPSLNRILAAGADLLLNPSFIGHLGQTIARAGAGLILATVLGVSFGLLLGRSESAHAYFRTLIEALRPIPSAAVIPFAIIKGKSLMKYP